MKVITHRSFWLNLVIAIVLIFLLLFLFFNSLDWLTKHGDTKKVPSVTGQNIDAATQLLKTQGFEVAVQDSVYIDTAAKSSVIRQSPEADAEVKENRTVYLTINRAVAPLIEMPDLKGFSFLSAKLYLQNLGLKMGDSSYKPDIARNSVLEQHYNNDIIAPGTKISMGSTISLVLGDGVGNATMSVPDLVGMTFGEASEYLATLNVGLGAVVADNGVSDRNSAYVYKQSPEKFSTDATGNQVKNRIRPGQVVDVWLSTSQPVVDTTSNQ